MKINCSHDALVELHKIVQNPKNPNKHTPDQIDRLSKIIDYQGQRSPIVVSNRSGFITKGHGRLMAITKLGWEKAAVDYQDYEDEAQEYADIVADNAIAEWSALDLSQINKDFIDLGPELDIEMLGIKDFAIEPIEKFEPQCDEDSVPDVAHPITVRGDVWLLGNHRLMCGDSTMIDDVEKLMKGHKADLLHTDPPYNVDYSNQSRPKAGKSDLGRIKNDKMSTEDFYSFLFESYSCAFYCLKEDSTAYIWHASSEQINFTKAFIDAGFNYTQQIIWKKPMLLGRGRYQWAHEPCLMGVKGSPYFTDDRKKTTVWDFGGYDKSNNLHPTQKPLFIPEEAINNSSKQGSNVLDLFGGSGSTLIACEKLSRNGFIMELDEKYCDVIINRWQNFTGKQATLESTGQTYEELKNERI